MSDLRIGGVPIAKLKVAELKAELEARELSKTGKKDELVARLISFMEVTTEISSCVDANDLFRPKRQLLPRILSCQMDGYDPKRFVGIHSCTDDHNRQHAKGHRNLIIHQLLNKTKQVNECSEPSSENSSRTDTPNAEVLFCLLSCKP